MITGINGGLFDIDTLQATALPPLPGGWSGFQSWAINEKGELAGTAFHGNVARSAAIWTVAGDWQSISPHYGLSSYVQAFDIDDAGIACAEVPQPAARFAGVGTVSLTALLAPPQQGQWAFQTNFGGAVNDAGQIAAIGQNLTTGASGVVLLTPLGPVACAGRPTTARRFPHSERFHLLDGSACCLWRRGANGFAPVGEETSP